MKVRAALSTGEMLSFPGLTPASRQAPRAAAEARQGQARVDRRAKAKTALARLKARDDRRKDWAEKTSTGLARRFDVIRVEDLKIKHDPVGPGHRRRAGQERRAKARLNTAHGRSGWGLLPPPEDKRPRPGREGTTRVHDPALQRVRARPPGEP